MTFSPYPFAGLVRRAFRELDERRSLFDLPQRRFVLGDPAFDFSARVHGLSAATPFGPAAGPHTQLAQNIVLSWLAGGRILELKTVQVRDDLEIPRPCIDMATIGFNIEWSQELRLEQSLDEYAKAAMLVRMLVASGRLALAPGFDRTVFDLSVGYDLAGLRTPKVDAFLRGAADLRDRHARLRREVPAEYARLRDVDVPDRLGTSVTLSTFHGCPPGEIVAMAQHLMRHHGLHTVVKLNPTLLGPRDARWLVNEVLGYHELRVPEHAFVQDTSWDQMVEMVGRLREDARASGVGFGIKLTNTLIVENHRDFFPPTERQMYLSGPPLHVLAVELLRRVRDVFGPELPISFSAGVDAGNFADTVALDLVPVTVCTDFLKPGGYGRGFAYFQHLRERMQASGVHGLHDFVVTGMGHGQAALDRISCDDETRRRARAALERCARAPADAASASLREVVDPPTYDAWVREAARLNTLAYAERVRNEPRYAAGANRRPPRKIGSRLQLFDCITCDKCVPVCPNDAIFTFVVPREGLERTTLIRHEAGWSRRDDDALPIKEQHQIGIFADFCNECGNCDVFCPEDGGPYLAKPLLFGSADAWRRAHPADGFFVSRAAGREQVLARFGGREFRLTLDGRSAAYQGDGFDVTFDGDAPETTIAGTARDGVRVELGYFHIMRALARSLYAPGAINYLTAVEP